ncbi:hypothetical protein GCM10022252_76900 [Streptosporangium oxazolinicum]|uniref:Uncharacterized protein n=1 Tax=Streptosporangium oxazolinicum TaxID=909287 RepID=A0ABP8BLJ8_9ACTN
MNLPPHRSAEGLPIGVMPTRGFGGEGPLISASSRIEAARRGFPGRARARRPVALDGWSAPGYF